MALQTAKAITILWDEVLETFQKESQMDRLVDVFRPDSALLQNSNNVIWRQVEQNRPVKIGWDMTGQFGNVIEQSYPAVVNMPYNDAFQLRADDFRDEIFARRAGTAAARRLSSDQQQRIAANVAATGSLFYRKSYAAINSGFAFVSEADAILNERQANRAAGASFFFNPRSYNTLAGDLAQRGTLSGLPEEAYVTGMIGKDIAGFDAYKSNYLPNLIGGASPTTTVATTVSYGPAVSQTGPGGVILPLDYRGGDIAFASVSGFNIGDSVSFTGVNAVGLLDKTVTNTPMTFRIVNINSAANTVTVWPRPIALNDPSLTPEQVAYANIATQITAGTAVNRNNTDASVVSNVFWSNDSMEIIAADAPMDKISEVSGTFKTLSETLDSGVTVYMMYQGDIGTATLNVRLLTWYGITNKDPSRNGVAVLTA
jgi:hypothetical protein